MLTVGRQECSQVGLEDSHGVYNALAARKSSLAAT